MTIKQYTIKRHNRKLDEQISPLLINHYLWLDNGYCPEVQVRASYSDTELRLQFRVYEENPLIRYRQMNDAVYQDSCVEFFWQPVPETDDRYLNFEFNAAGTLLLGLGADRETLSLLNVDPELFQIQTTINNEERFAFMSRVFWTLEFQIPFAWLCELFPSFLPEPGRLTRGNFYKCGDKTEYEHYGCWNEVTSEKPDFHRSSDFGHIYLER